VVPTVRSSVSIAEGSFTYDDAFLFYVQVNQGYIDQQNLPTLFRLNMASKELTEVLD
jgi:hypothetical protein